MRLDETAITGFERQTVRQRLVQFHLKLRIDLLQVPTGKGHFTGQRGIGIKHAGNRRHGGQTIAQGCEITRPPPSHSEP